MPGPNNSVLVVDDDVRIASAVKRALTYEGHDVEVVHSGEDALRRFMKGNHGLVILDVMMPGMDGVEVCRRMRRRDPAIAILMLTARADIPDRVHGLDAGADDYLVKPFAYEELLARVRGLLRRAGSARGDGSHLAFADLVMDVDAMEVRRGDRLIDLTTLQFNLLEYFMRNPRLVLSRTRTLEAVWGLDTETTSNIVDVYVRYLRQRLEADGEPRLIHTVRGVGYILKES